MSKLVTSALLCAAAALPLSAPAVPVPCIQQSYQDYVALGTDGCTSGPLTFSDFKFLGPDLDPTMITVDPVLGSLTFNVNMMVATMDGGQKSVTFTYTVADDNGITAAALSFIGSAVDPDADSRVKKTFEDGTLEVFESTAVVDGKNVTTSKKSDSVTFTEPFPTSLDVSETATVSVKPAGNIRAASINSFTNTFAGIPEPGTLALLLAGSALALLARRRGLAAP